MTVDGVGELHLAVCRRFGEAVRAAEGRWERRSPCEDWDARGVLEHVIGFHDVLLLRRLGLKPDRPRDDPQERWASTYEGLERAVEAGLPSDARALLPKLTRDVLVHTWDLARAVGADDRLDARWCEHFYLESLADPAVLSASGMFKAPVVVDEQADMQSRLLARLGRDPNWR
ncbi:maleylpyruvate isomerase family mycothiol-dependent enzyme [Mycobacterium talmoniae]|uniref:Mycothiol-dependent maleylpyruvate isomerase metal-binding domain-containing protein n=1 Tax=Mycobacterium talmoniae TaxID=1858794 RepID=A0A1S1NH70_9MYCO|nr:MULTISPECIES: maleylpyruvate isomerase family mycothiol-dependent enzyme [Mycobacterium]OHV01770.1 hypothetical protein BKN37_16500 [Mycobacterium talmoniae]PQM47679.1 hypothetical protein C1Y40_02115 [Mycobacterium talmoniae]TDH56540.1 maleylpyruvate isomerase family mycothiol-dependent enzyme [Mycobacterium eburneum]